VRTATLPLSQCDQLIDLLVHVDNMVAVAQDRIKEAKKLLREFNYQKISYFALAEFATMILNAINHLTHIHSYYCFSLDALQAIISSIISKYGQKKLREGMAIQAHVMQMKQYLLAATCQQLSYQLFRDHHLLLSLLLSTKLLECTGKVSSDEASLLLLLDTQQPTFTSTVLTLTEASLPAWMTRRVCSHYNCVGGYTTGDIYVIVHYAILYSYNTASLIYTYYRYGLEYITFIIISQCLLICQISSTITVLSGRNTLQYVLVYCVVVKCCV